MQPGSPACTWRSPPPTPPGRRAWRHTLSVKDFLAHVFPASVTDALAKNEILQIVVFSVFAGIATAAVGERAKPFLDGVEALAAVMLKVTNYVMLFAPVAVFAAIAASVATQGLGRDPHLRQVRRRLLCGPRRPVGRTAGLRRGGGGPEAGCESSSPWCDSPP